MHKLSSEPDELASLAAGDVAAFDAIYKRHYGAVYTNIRKLVKAPEHAEDLLQEVFVSHPFKGKLNNCLTCIHTPFYRICSIYY